MIVIIDDNDYSRSQILFQLKSLNLKSEISQFKNIESFSKSLIFQKKLNELSLLIIQNLPSEFKNTKSLIQNLRVKSPECAILIVSETITQDQIKDFVRSGVSQILIRPYKAEQLLQKIRQAQKFVKQMLEENKKTPTQHQLTPLLEEFTEKVFTLKLTGWITENTELPTLLFQTEEVTLFLDCDQVKGINSIGVRNWLIWIKELSQKGVVRFEFQNVRELLLKQFSMIQGFIPTNGNIHSFYLNYYNQEYHIERDFKFELGKDFTSNNFDLPGYQDHFFEGKTIKLEVSPAYLKVLNFYKGKINLV